MSLTKASYSMITAAPINVYDYGVVGDGTTNDTAALQAAVTAASGKQLWLGTGNFKITATINLPQRIRITGATNRATNTMITAAFAGPALKYTAGSGTALEMYLEHFQVSGNYLTYGAGNGIEITNGSSFNMHSMVVSGFGTNQLNLGSGSYGAIIRDCYFAETYGTGTSNANIYCASEYCVFDKIESDDGKYSIYFDTGAYGNDIINGTLEGSSTASIYIKNQSTIDRNLVQGCKINGTRGGIGIYTNSNRTHIINNFFVGDTVTNAIYVDGFGYNALIDGNSISSSIKGIYDVSSGGSIITSNEISGSTAAINFDGGAGFPTFPNIVSNNNISSDAATILHNQSGGNSNTVYVNNTLTNLSGVYKAPTITTGTPVILSFTSGSQLQMINGTMYYPANSLVVAGGGGTNIVSVGAADSGGTGYRMLRIPN
jgi:parallel beta-helix repeat protein